MYVEPFPKSEAKYQIAQTGFPLWSPDGKELIMNYGPSDYRITTVQTQPQFTFSAPAPLHLRMISVDPAEEVRNFDIMPGGQRFVGVTMETSDSPGKPFTPQIQVVLNWFRELQVLVPVK